jgi:hypothetical protein
LPASIFEAGVSIQVLHSTFRNQIIGAQRSRQSGISALASSKLIAVFSCAYVACGATCSPNSAGLDALFNVFQFFPQLLLIESAFSKFPLSFASITSLLSDRVALSS